MQQTHTHTQAPFFAIALNI